MKMSKATSVEDFKLVSSFESLRKTLMQEKYTDRLEKPLAFWALPSDRRLPLAFLGRSLGTLLSTPFEELNATPGIGQKKISSLMKLLARATKDEPPAIPFGITELAEDQGPAETAARPDMTVPASFDPMMVSEALWEQWRDTVGRIGVAHEKLGRLAPSLQLLPTVIWHTPLSAYLELSVEQIRQKKTHGEKRVRVVLEVFCVVHQMLTQVGKQDHLDVQLTPSFVSPIEQWINKILDIPGVPSESEISENLAKPLLAQVEIDAGDTIVQLAEGRLGITGPPQSVRMQSRRMGVTRARIYQLLDDCSKVMNVRWPEGQMMLKALNDKFKHEKEEDDDLRLFEATLELFYPRKYDETASLEERA